ncbi:class C beta-lactamase-related serine hydrolase [Altericroceibacterium spongiae]|uniref:Class C beta-lactamase-related serine hydrolase n=1 Tax=Altericroceibacterium spongiae TaxID=2320269 RepID=A0A420EEL8_9SPHN|nr:serine hydrolase [Altericroceibacterium spongiae]RKF19131.1 class C beta-lactamase-related serine hydrolase [Altericroceibacterium spongiae]
MTHLKPSLKPRSLRLPALGAIFLTLAACSSEKNSAPPPIPPEVMATIADHPGVNRKSLARATDALFTREDLGQTQALIVYHEGEIVAERYAKGYDDNSRFLGWSMSKSVVGVMIGMMIAEGRLTLDDSPPIAHWQRPGDPRGEITVRQLLQMRSGLRHQEVAEPLYRSDTVRMLLLDGRDDMAEWAEAQPLEYEPGQMFEYSTPGTVILSDTIARILAPKGTADERQQAVARFLKARLAEPVGMDSLTAEYDASGTMIGGSMLWATARDWGRFGEFLRHGGSVKGVQIVPRGWIDFMRRPSPRAADYGALIWLNRPTESGRNELFAEQGPADAFAAIGHLGQYVIVSPGDKLTIVRLGNTPQNQRPALVAALGDIVHLYSSGM